ncbi:MAG: prolyl oligopeptidase family serine peptidase [Pirellula sp.]|nr:prolyl oligopeptidase family serine peptidase [Pirellula sp.]
MLRRLLFVLGSCLCLGQNGLYAQLQPDGATASFRGSLPPKPTAMPSSEKIAAWSQRLVQLTQAFTSVKSHPRAADADIFLKAVRYAIEFEEWYGKKPEDSERVANALLDEASQRIDALQKNKTPWMDGSGQKTLGFYSSIDGSPQPYGVEVPEGLAFGANQPSVPMWIWLHGRGDTTTDLQFVYSRLTAKKPGQFQPKGTIVIHPFGRYCNGWKSAGETDVFEARNDAIARFNIDRNRIALAGFSMGGAGAWHIGAHFADQWACVHTGAGFVDVKRYQKVTPDKMPVWYEQALWGVYDVPAYARNFHNVPLVCYSGEVDPQRDSAEYMVEVLDKEGLHPPHLIGPEMGHKYHPEVIKDVQARIESYVSKGLDTSPKKVVLQTRTLAYSRMHWLQITSIENQWEDARAEAVWEDGDVIRITTKNVGGIELRLPAIAKVFLNGTETASNAKKDRDVVWSWQKKETASNSLHKRPGLQGPIDDGLKSRFIVVLPDREPDSGVVHRWVREESSHFLVRWRSLMRGDPTVRKASEVSEADIRDCHLVLWGTPASNSLIARTMASASLKSVLQWDERVVRIGTQESPASQSIPVLCYPNPLNPNKYVIINSGLTFREAHDKTNSLQNPKLPDWAILDVSEPPTAISAGRVVAADFFDCQWKALPRAKSPADRDLPVVACE